MAIEAGDTLGGKYRLDALIGRGGMGQVFAATDTTTTASVAVKVVSRLLFDDVLMARLLREAEAARIIRSEYVPRVLEVSETKDSEIFLVMERLVGDPLSQRMRDKGPLPWSEVAQIGADVLHGLIDAHTAGIVHRDLKPSNVFLALRSGRVRAMILDFGVCKIDRQDAEHLTGTGESIGTVAYMAPEQIRGAADVDDRADLFAFGVLVFEMLAGRLPHEGPSQMAILASKLEDEALRLRDHARVAVPAGLDDLIAKALARDPQDRFGSAQDLLKAWRGLSETGVVAPTPAAPFTPGVIDDEPATEVAGSSKVELPETPTETALTAGISLRKGSTGRFAFVLAACGLALGFAGVVAFFARAPSATIESSTPAIVAPLPTATEAATTTDVAALPSVEDDDASAAEPAAPSSTSPAKPPRLRRPLPRAGGTHITDKPRY